MNPMNTKRIIKASALLAAAIGILASCVFTVLSINLPDNMQAGTTVEITTNMSCFHVQSDQTSHFVFGMLVPSNWNAGENTTVTVSTSDRPAGQQGKPDVVNASMHLMDPSATDPTTGLTWSASFQSKFGSCGNYGLTEWVVFESDDEYVICWGDNMTWYLNATIKMKLPETNTKFYFANAFCGTNNGLYTDDNGNYFSDAPTVLFSTTGGSGKEDYTVPPLTSITPLKFTYEDIFAVNFVSEAGTVVTDLKGENEVYLQAECTLKSGKTITVTEKSSKTLMKKTSDIDYYKYIYPRQFFSLSSSDKIASIKVWFSDKNGSKVENSGGDLFELSETGTPLN